MRPAKLPSASAFRLAIPASRSGATEALVAETSKLARGSAIVPSITARPSTKPEASSAGRTAFRIASGRDSIERRASIGSSVDKGSVPSAETATPWGFVTRASRSTTPSAVSEPSSDASRGAIEASRRAVTETPSASRSNVPRGSVNVPERSTVPRNSPVRPRSGSATPPIDAGSSSKFTFRSSGPPASGIVPSAVAATPCGFVNDNSASSTRLFANEPATSRSSGSTPAPRSGAAVASFAFNRNVARGSPIVPDTDASPEAVPDASSPSRNPLATASGRSASARFAISEPAAPSPNSALTLPSIESPVPLAARSVGTFSLPSSNDPATATSSAPTLPRRSGAAVTSSALSSNRADGSVAVPSTRAVPDTVPPRARSGRTVLATSRSTSLSERSRSSVSPAVPDARTVPSPTSATRSSSVTVPLAIVTLVGALSSTSASPSRRRRRSRPTRKPRPVCASSGSTSAVSAEVCCTASGVPAGESVPASSAVAEPLTRALASNSVSSCVPLAVASSSSRRTPPATTPRALARPSTTGTPNASATVASTSAWAMRAAFTITSRRAAVRATTC